MGLLTLAGFRDEMDIVLGERGISADRRNTWINFGYLDAATAIDFEVLDSISTLVMTNGSQLIQAPNNILAIKVLRDDAEDRSLSWEDKAEFFRLSITESGPPRRWTRVGPYIYVWPVPDADGTLFAISKKAPEPLVGELDKTVLQSQYDQLVWMLAMSHAFAALGEDTRSAVWYNKAVAFASSRITDRSLERGLSGLVPARAVSLPSTVAEE